MSAIAGGRGGGARPYRVGAPPSGAGHPAVAAGEAIGVATGEASASGASTGEGSGVPASGAAGVAAGAGHGVPGPFVGGVASWATAKPPAPTANAVATTTIRRRMGTPFRTVLPPRARWPGTAYATARRGPVNPVGAGGRHASTTFEGT